MLHYLHYYNNYERKSELSFERNIFIADTLPSFFKSNKHGLNQKIYSIQLISMWHLFNFIYRNAYNKNTR